MQLQGIMGMGGRGGLKVRQTLTVHAHAHVAVLYLS